jgi:hypothetical protein
VIQHHPTAIARVVEWTRDVPEEGGQQTLKAQQCEEVFYGS